ncbi:MAG TPA: alpha/beta fold hydrolase [Thermoanaerobaculia bacterium]|jgi:pimeloyl-ACP methyl ester carboxylesterase
MRLEWGGQAIDVREAGSGPSIVLVHGYPLDGAMWSGVARTLAARFRVLKPDLPGRGENPAAASGDIEGYADFLEALVAALPSPVGVAGFSMGGYVALALLRRRPENVRAVAFVDTRAEADDEEGKKKRDEAIATVRADGVEKIADGMVPRLLSEPALAHRDLVERVRRIILRQKPETVAADLTAMRGRRDATDLLAGLGLPALVVVGERDALTPPALSERMASAIPGARLVTIPGAGHLAPMERPGAVAAALGEFFIAVLA